MLSEALITSFQTVASSLWQSFSHSVPQSVRRPTVFNGSLFAIAPFIAFAIPSAAPLRSTQCLLLLLRRVAWRQVLLLRQLDGVLINCSINLMFSSCLLLIFFIHHAPFLPSSFAFSSSPPSLPGETRVQPSLRCPKCQLSVHFQWPCASKMSKHNVCSSLNWSVN